MSSAPSSKVVIGNATLFHGDFFELVKALPAKSVSSVVSSPPFRYQDLGLASDEEYYEWLHRVLKELERVTVDYALLFNSSNRLLDIVNRFDVYDRPLIWDKYRGQEAFRYEPVFIHRMPSARFNITASIFCDCYHCASMDKEVMAHPYENPLEIYERWLLNILTHKSALKFTRTILDPFAGSGKTLLACNNLGLKSVGFEISRKYFEVAASIVRDGEGSCTAHEGTKNRIQSAMQQTLLTEGGLHC